jgi:hypothetical protein
MITQLSTVKSRLAIDPLDTTYDNLLTATISAISTRFDKETNRTLARTTGITEEFSADQTEILVPCYPIESVTKFELKSTEAEGWIEQTGIDYLIRRKCIISLALPLSLSSPSSISNLPSPVARVTYTGGYVLPGATPSAGQTALPDDLEQAAVEQVAHWFQTREMLGLDTIWPHAGTYEKFSKLSLLLPVQAVLKHYQRWVL